MVAKRVQRVWQRHHLLHPNQHGFRPQYGTHTAILHVLNRLEGAHAEEPLFITFWDIRRAFDSIPKWIQRLAWARLGISEEDLEWFLGLDATGLITVRTPYQQHRMTPSNGHQILSGGKMLHPHKNSFHPDRGIGQGDTPSTLIIFIAVFDIMLTLLETSETGDAHAYADDLAHLAKTLAAQQRQADLVCGFAAYTGIEISVQKVEAISVFNSRIMYDTPHLTLHDWAWTEHRIQHCFWTRYLGLFLDNQASLKHFEKASAQLSNLCHTLRRKLAPPDVKHLVYTLSVKAQIRYPAGLAPWTLQQYQLLDKKPTSLLRQVYGLRRTFPTALIYTQPVWEDVVRS